MEGKREGEGEGVRGREEKGKRTRGCKPRKFLRGWLEMA